MTFNHIRLALDGSLATLTLNSPSTRNALWFGEGSIRDEIVMACGRCDADEAIKSVLIDAAGEDFCAGANLKKTAARTTPLEQEAFFARSGRFLNDLRETSKPIVASVHGRCLGAGLGLIAQCDLVVAAEDSRFGLVEGPLGLPGAADLVPIIGPAWAKYLIFTGDLISAAQAREIGLVFATVPRAMLGEASRDLAARIARAPGPSTRLNKRGINAVAEALGHRSAPRAARAYDALTAEAAATARAPDGRPFREILAEEGIAGLRGLQPAEAWTVAWPVNRAGSAAS
jgi:enoyl-CoA hydratase/carnithine racemase